MPQPQELPRLVSDLATMSKEYLVQETVEPAKKLARHAGFGIAAAAVLAFAALFLILGVYAGLKTALGLTALRAEWAIVLARLGTAIIGLALTGLLGWRMTSE